MGADRPKRPSADRSDVSEAPVLRATGVIVVVGVLIAGGITAFALLRPSVFETSQLQRPSGTLTPGEEIALEKARFDARNSARETGLRIAAGVGALAAALLTWGRLELSRAERHLIVQGT